MTITQTVEVPDSHRLTIDVPREIPAGQVILTFTPVSSDQRSNDRKSANVGGEGLDYEGECPLCAAKNYMPNAETIAAIEEGRAMMRGEIPSKLYDSTDEMWEDLDRDDSED